MCKGDLVSNQYCRDEFVLRQHPTDEPTQNRGDYWEEGNILPLTCDPTTVRAGGETKRFVCRRAHGALSWQKRQQLYKGPLL